MQLMKYDQWIFFTFYLVWLVKDIIHVSFLLMMLSCSKCACTDLETLKSLIQHIGTCHANDPYFSISCGINDCPTTYKKFSSYRSHVYRKHRESLCVQFERNAVAVPTLTCPLCWTNLCDISEVSSHLCGHIEKEEIIECPFKNCFKKYGVCSSLSSHLSRSHQLTQISEEKVLKTIWYEHCVTVNDDNFDIANTSAVDYNSEFSNTGYTADQFQDIFTRLYAGFLLKLQEQYILPLSTIQHILMDIAHVIETKTKFEKQKVPTVLKEHFVDKNIIVDITDIFDMDVFQATTETLCTDWRRKKYYKEKFGHVPPQMHDLGRNSKGQKRNFQYVPILDTLKMMLSNGDVWQEVIGHLPYAESVIHDYRDGTLFKTNELFSSDPNALQIMLYFDEFEVVNPLGCHRKTHKVSAFYYVLGNILPAKRSALHVIQLAVMCRNVDLKEFGLDKLLKPLIEDCRILETEGVFVDSANQTFRGTIAVLSGDNLGSHFAGGFMESFSGGEASRLCRFCTATRKTMQTCFNPKIFHLRTSVLHNKHVKLVSDYPELASVFGVKSKSPLNNLKYFHVIGGLPPDIMHDILEGILQYELALIIPKLVTDGYITIEYINNQIRNWKYGPLDSTSRPVELSPDLVNKVTLKMSASRMWCFIRLLPLMVLSKIPSENLCYQLIIQLKQIVDIVFAPTLPKPYVGYLDTLIQEHFSVLHHEFPDFQIKPKFHYILHYPDMILAFGPLIRVWCMRFEAKHSYFKRKVHSARNFINICSTLASRHQLMQITHNVTGSFLKPELEVGNSVEIDLTILHEDIKLLFESVGISENGYIYTIV